MAVSAVVVVVVAMWGALLPAQAGGAASSASSFSDDPIYVDVASGSESFGQVQSLARAGVFAGTDCAVGRFCPDESLRRWELAVWLARALGQGDVGTIGRSRFADVDAGAWWAPYVERLAELGVAVGCSTGPGSFCPQAVVDRGEFAGFLARGVGLPALDSVGFGDIAGRADAAAINSVAAAEIVEGCSERPLRFCPTRTVSKAHGAASIIEALDWLQLNTIAESSPVPGDIFLTEYNEFSWYVKTQIIDRYGADQPWLKAAWNVTNWSKFKYLLLPNQWGMAVDFGFSWPHDEYSHLVTRTMSGTSLNHLNRRNHPNIVHELAHVYTKSNRVANNPWGIAAAHLYFEELAEGALGCIPYEIFADTAPDLIFEIKQSSHYWGMCAILPTNDATEEAIGVVRDAFSGQVPQWFYDTFQKSDGSLDLDYEAIWSAVNGIEDEISRSVVVYQLRNAFGGYCAAYYYPPPGTPRESVIYLNPAMTDQPWVDGGCGDSAAVDDNQRAGSDEAAATTVVVRIVARKLDSGRIEFGLQQRHGDTWENRQLPRVRFFPTTAGVNRWLTSSALDLPPGDVRIVARKLDSGRIEFGLQQRHSDTWENRQLPRVRFFPTTAGVNRWLTSSALTLTAP